MVTEWASGQEKVCPGCISETIWSRKLIFGKEIGSGCRCAVSWCDLDLNFDLAKVTLSLKILCGLYLGNRKLILGRDIGWGLYVCNIMV